MRAIVHFFSTKHSNIILALLVILLMGRFTSCKSSRPSKPIKSLLEAQEEAREIAQLIYNTDNSEKYAKKHDEITQKWDKNYITYFETKQKVAPEFYKQFLQDAYDIAVSTTEIMIKYSNYIQEKNKWYPILEFRDAAVKTLDAIASIAPNLQKELINAKADIAKIPGGCDSGTCPLVSSSLVQPEARKLLRLLNGIDKMLVEIRFEDEQFYRIAKQGITIAIEAIREFEKKTQNFSYAKMEPERQKLFHKFVYSTALFTIALKELFETKSILHKI